MLARALRLSGVEAAATYIAANHRIAEKQPIRPRAQLRRLEHLRQAAEVELRTAEPANRTTFAVGDVQLTGRQVSLDLSQQREIIGRVSVSQGVTLAFLEQLLALDISGQRRDRLDPELLETISGIQIKGEDEKSASLKIGSAFTAELRLGARGEAM